MLEKSKNKLRKKEKEKARNSRFINLTSVAMVIEQEKSIKSTTFEIGKHEKLENIFLSISPPQLPTKFYFPVFLWFIFAFCHDDPHFSRAQLSAIFFSPFSIQKCQLCGSWICRSDPLVGSPQIWKLFMAQNKNQLTIKTDNLATRARTIRSIRDFRCRAVFLCRSNAHQEIQPT